MATILKRGGKYQAQVRRLGHKPVSRTFTLKSDAAAWARKVESEIERGTYVDRTPGASTTLSQMLSRYRKEILPKLSSTSQEVDGYRLNTLDSKLGHHSLAALTPAVVSDYRNTRLKVVSAGTVLRELGVLSRVLSACRQEWGIEVRNSVTEIQKPKAPRGRDRRLRQGEIDLILAVLQPTMQAVVRFAIETAMRRGEIAAMKFEDVDRAHRTLLIPATKTGVPRTIPLSCGAFQIIEGMGDKDARGPVFGMTATTISQAFRRACRRAGLEDLHLHDLRHEATSRLFEKGLAVMEVALVTGHADVRMLARYTHLRAGDLVCKLG